jgi:hypothetical protein
LLAEQDSGSLTKGDERSRPLRHCEKMAFSSDVPELARRNRMLDCVPV